ncbi:alpha/beta fold hydrolase [Streptantibioticus silvisoli]|uniref:alpha/beta fold hydrolase n=1 Tax=Streptantibioticus silvisoli TaxID=2705255 RepID=UPI0027E23E01|nr:alpha/beta hydrolase [Streptantibioticus silvisoli]
MDVPSRNHVKAGGRARVTFLSDHRADPAAVTVPTRVAHCSHDTIAPPQVGGFVHTEVAGGRLGPRNAAGHCPQLAAPEKTTAAVLSFVGDTAFTGGTG